MTTLISVKKFIKIGLANYTMSLLYTFKEFDPKTCLTYIILGFGIFSLKGQYSNSEGHNSSSLTKFFLFLFLLSLAVERTHMNSSWPCGWHSDIPSESCSGVELGGRLASRPQRCAVPGVGWGIVLWLMVFSNFILGIADY